MSLPTLLPNLLREDKQGKIVLTEACRTMPHFLAGQVMAECSLYRRRPESKKLMNDALIQCTGKEGLLYSTAKTGDVWAFLALIEIADEKTLNDVLSKEVGEENSLRAALEKLDSNIGTLDADTIKALIAKTTPQVLYNLLMRDRKLLRLAIMHCLYDGFFPTLQLKIKAMPNGDKIFQQMVNERKKLNEELIQYPGKKGLLYSTAKTRDARALLALIKIADEKTLNDVLSKEVGEENSLRAALETLNDHTSDQYHYRADALQALIAKTTPQVFYNLLMQDRKLLLFAITQCGNNLYSPKLMRTLMEKVKAMPNGDKFYQQAVMLQIYSKGMSLYNKLAETAEALQYHLNPPGICHGFSYMAIQALLHKESSEKKSNGFDEFCTRLNRIDWLSSQEHARNLKLAREKLKNKKHISDDEKHELTRLGLDDKKQYAVEELTDDERLALELPAFFEGIELYQDSIRKYDHLYDAKNNQVPLTQTDIESKFALAMSIKLEEEGGVASVARFSGVYNKKEIDQYFTELRTAALESKSFVALTLGGSGHIVTVAFDPSIDKFILIDTNQLPPKQYSLMEIAENARIALTVGMLLNEEDRLAITTTVLSLAKDQPTMQTMCHSWHNSMQDIHRITPEKIGLDVNRGSWEQQAYRSKEGELWAELRVAGQFKESFLSRHQILFLIALAIGLTINAIIIVASPTLIAFSALFAVILVAEAALAGAAFDWFDKRKIKQDLQSNPMMKQRPPHQPRDPMMQERPSHQPQFKQLQTQAASTTKTPQHQLAAAPELTSARSLLRPSSAPPRPEASSATSQLRKRK